MVNAPWYTCNSNVHRNLGVPLVAQEIRFSAKNDTRLHHHANSEALQPLDSQHLAGRLKRCNPFELV